jgi:hypothetical protein
MFINDLIDSTKQIKSNKEIFDLKEEQDKLSVKSIF